MTKYEYQIYDTALVSPRKTLGESLNEAAEHGWRLVPLNAGKSSTVLIMEREVPGDD